MFRREVRDLLIAAPKESSLMHDHLAFIVASSLGRIVFSEEALVKYRQHPGNNIGAFFPSVSNGQQFQEKLNGEIGILRALLPIDMKRLEHFLNEKAHENILSRLRFIRYYLYLRPDTLFNKLLGVFACLFPRLYQRLRQESRADRTM